MEDFKENLQRRGIKFIINDEQKLVISRENNAFCSVYPDVVFPDGVVCENHGLVRLNSKFLKSKPLFRNKGEVEIVSYQKKKQRDLIMFSDRLGVQIIFEH